MFDPRLAVKIIKIVDVSYGGDNGFNQAIELASESLVLLLLFNAEWATFRLANVKFIQEKKLITKFFEEVAQDTGKYVFGIQETLQALEMGAVELLIVWEALDIQR